MVDNVLNLSGGNIDLPGTMVGVVRDHAIDAGVLPQLTPEQPTIFGPVKGAVFSGVPRAKIVGESEQKPASQGAKITSWTAQPIKLVTQQRISDEFMWGDTDYRLGVVQGIVAPAIGASIGRAVDLIAFHGINPATGVSASQVKTSIANTKNFVSTSTSPTEDLTKAVGMLAGHGVNIPNGVALNPEFSYQLATEVYPKGAALAGQPIYPQATFAGMDSWRGLKTVKSSTVSGEPEISLNVPIQAIIGDWSRVHWGFQRNFPISIIEYGDPDQTGRDLKAYNEVLMRAEAVVYVAIEDPNSFAAVEGKYTSKPETSGSSA